MREQAGPFLRMIARLRGLRALDGLRDPAAQEASPFLILVAVVLALLLAILEAELQSAELQSLGLFRNTLFNDPLLTGP